MGYEIREGNNNDNVLTSIMFAIKRNVILMLIIVFAITGAGVVFSFLRPKSYTASEQVIYRAQNAGNETVKNNVNAMNAFVYTIADFCDEGVVVDRANFYFNDYKKQIERVSGNLSVDDYIKNVRTQDTYIDETIIDTKYITSENISVKTSSDENSTRFSFVISYKDRDDADALNKVKLLILAFDMESAETIVVDGVVRNKYFDGINNYLIDYGTVSITSNVSKTKTVIISFLLGMVLAGVAVGAKSLVDNTVKEKYELEKICGVPILSTIDYDGGEENGTKE